MIGNLIRWAILRPLLKPLTRIVVGLIAIPIFRFVMRRGMRMAQVERELEQDLEEWFRAALILLVATANMEALLFGWVPLDLDGDQSWVGIFFRLLLVVGVIELMPDQALFSVLHAGPIKLPFGKGFFRKMWEGRVKFLKDAGCMHLNRSSPVLAMMSAIFGGGGSATADLIGWVCYFLAIAQYLIIALITTSDKAGDLLNEFDEAVSQRRQDLVKEFGEQKKEE